MISLKQLDKNSTAAVLAFFKSCSGYFLMAEGQEADEAAVTAFFEERPPACRPEEKHLFGVFEGEMLIGVIDLVENYPEQGEWIIGLMLFHPDRRGKGLGRMVHRELTEIARAGGARKMRVGVVEQNTGGLAFWTRLGYREKERTAPRLMGQKESIIIVMNLEI